MQVRRPSKTGQLPYDLFQYFAGIYQRLVEDSQRSYHLILQLKKSVDIGTVNRLRNRVEKLIRHGITMPYAWNTTFCDFELTEIGNKLGAQTIEQLRKRVHSLKSDPLYHEFVPILDDSPIASNRRGSVLFVFGRRGKELDQIIRSAVMTSVREAQTALPIIVAVHLYQDIDFEEFRNRPSIKGQFLPWTDSFFKENPKVAMIWISSNHEIYLAHTVGDDQIGLRYARNGFLIESPEWDHKDIEELGI